MGSGRLPGAGCGSEGAGSFFAKNPRGEDSKREDPAGICTPPAEQEQAGQHCRVYLNRLQAALSELTLMEERERRRLACDLHDLVGQSLAAANLKLERFLDSYAFGQGVVELEEIRELIVRTIERTRSLTFELSPPVLYDLGLEAAVEWLTEKIQEDHGLSVVLKKKGKFSALDEGLRVLLYHAVRELLINAVKHARAKHVLVTILQRGGTIRITVEDDGVGFRPCVDRGKGFGLFNIQEHIGRLGGGFHVETRSGGGTRTVIQTPLIRPGR